MEKKNIIIAIIALITLTVIGIIGWQLWSAVQTKEPQTEEVSSDTSSNNSTDETDSNNNSSSNQNQNQSTTTTVRSTTELNTAIIQQEPALLKDGEPVFSIANTKRVDTNWYVVRLRNIEIPSAGTAWVILKDTNGSLVVVAGPGTSFPPSAAIPDSVRKAIK